MDNEAREDLKWWAVAGRAAAESAEKNGLMLTQEFARTELQRLSQGVLDLLDELEEMERELEGEHDEVLRLVSVVHGCKRVSAALMRERDEARATVEQYRVEETEAYAELQRLKRERDEAQAQLAMYLGEHQAAGRWDHNGDDEVSSNADLEHYADALQNTAMAVWEGEEE